MSIKLSFGTSYDFEGERFRKVSVGCGIDFKYAEGTVAHNFYQDFSVTLFVVVFNVTLSVFRHKELLP